MRTVLCRVGFSICFLGFVLCAVLATGSKLVFNVLPLLVLSLGVVIVSMSQTVTNVSNDFKRILSLAVLLSAYILVRAWLSPVTYLARQDCILVLSGLVGLVGGGLAQRSNRWATSALGVAVIAGFLISIHQLASDQTFYILGWLGYSRPATDTGASGVFVYHNYYSCFSGMCAFYLLGAAFVGKERNWRTALIIILFVLSVLSVIFSRSRGGLIAFALGLSFLLVALGIRHRDWLRDYKRSIIFGFLLAGIIFLPLGILAYSQLNERETNLASAKSVRFSFAKAAIEQFTERPIVGNGAASYSYQIYQNWPSNLKLLQQDPEYAHNDYAQFLAEYGIVGFALLALLLLIILKAFFGHKRYEETFFKCACMAAIVVGLSQSLIDFVMHAPVNMLLLGFVVGRMAGDTTRRHNANTKGNKIAGSGIRLLAISIFILVGSFVWQYLSAEIDSEKATFARIDGRRLEALQLWRRVLDRDPANYEAAMSAAKTALEIGGDQLQTPGKQSFVGKSIEFGHAAISANAHLHIAHLHLGYCYDLQGDEQNAAAQYRLALEKAPWRGECYLGMARHHLIGAVREFSTDQSSNDWARISELLELSESLILKHEHLTWASMESLKERRLILNEIKRWQGLMDEQLKSQ